jgi:hypothetical protein
MSYEDKSEHTTDEIQPCGEAFLLRLRDHCAMCGAKRSERALTERVAAALEEYVWRREVMAPIPMPLFDELDAAYREWRKPPNAKRSNPAVDNPKDTNETSGSK